MSNPHTVALKQPVQALAYALEARDPYTAGHSHRVSLLAQAMARTLGWTEHEVRTIGFAAELHDVGKIGIPEHLLQKRDGLTESEYRIVMRHTVIGEKIVAPLFPYDRTVRHVVRWHHERYDGRGAGALCGHAIPMAARIVSLADAYDAMTSRRPYRPALSRAMALREVRRSCGSQFDPDCVAAFETIAEGIGLQVSSHSLSFSSVPYTTCKQLHA